MVYSMVDFSAAFLLAKAGQRVAGGGNPGLTIGSCG